MRPLFLLTLFAAFFAAFFAALPLRADGPRHRQLQAVPFTDVKVADAFWAPRLTTNRERSLPHNFAWCEQTGRISNFAKAAGLMEGKFEGIYFNDSDLYKVLEGASYSLADHPDPAMEATVDGIIAKIAAAQQPDGYLNTYYTLAEPGKRWTNTAAMHELYCSGHFIEAAVAHHRATGKRTLLDVAIRLADHIDATFGPNGLHETSGHEEIELALVKLYQLTGEERYLKLAEFFLDIRGDASKRPNLYGVYCQDHQPVREQSEVAGHAVRAMYLYCGVADVAGYTGDEGFFGMTNRLWDDVANCKMYITGGVGARHEGEAFGDRWELPNESAYCETCAAIGLALWAHRLNMLHGDARYADVVERVIFNGFLSGVALDGEHYFYVNPLASAGNHHRQPFYGCACCPTNVVRFMPSIPGYVYATGEQGIHVNLYVAGTAQATVAGQKVALQQATRYPWDGQVALAVSPERPAEFDVALRIPGWCREATLAVNGQPQPMPALQRGYAVLRRTWKAGDRVELNLAMPVERIEAHPAVEADRGRVAIQRGPVVYCLEGVDNAGSVRSRVLPHDPQFTVEHQPDLLGGISVIRGVDRAGKPIQAVPYYAWDHREPSEMAVWLRQDGKSRAPQVDDPSWKGVLYRPLDPATLGPSVPPTLLEAVRSSASHCWTADSVEAIHDEVEPKDSNDHSIPRFTWWDHRGSAEWVEYAFDAPQKLRAVEVYWFDDQRKGGQCRVPASARLLYRDGEEWKPIPGTNAVPVALDRFNRVEFAPLETTGLRLEVQLQPDVSAGILEWKLETVR